MSVWFVSRHPGARAWVAAEGYVVDRFVDHLDVEQVQRGDTVIGILPVHCVAVVCARGARYLHLCLDLEASHRGCELTVAAMREAGARLEEFVAATPAREP